MNWLSKMFLRHMGNTQSHNLSLHYQLFNYNSNFNSNNLRNNFNNNHYNYQ